VFNDFDALYAELVSLRTATNQSGLFTIVFDDSLAPTNIPDGGTYDMLRTSWLGAIVEGSPQVRPSDIGFESGVVGTVITNLFSITGCDVSNGNGDAPTPPIRLTTGQALYLDRAQIQNGDEVNGVVYVTGSAAIHMGDESALQGAAGGGGQPGVLVADAATLTLHMNGSTSTLEGSGAVIAEGATSALVVLISSSSALYALQTTFTLPPDLTMQSAHG